MSSTEKRGLEVNGLVATLLVLFFGKLAIIVMILTGIVVSWIFDALGEQVLPDRRATSESE